MGSADLPVEYEVLVAQIAAAQELLEQLRAAPPSPKVKAALDLVEEAQLRMLAALAWCESANRDS